MEKFDKNAVTKRILLVALLSSLLAFTTADTYHKFQIRIKRETSPALGYRLKFTCNHCFITFYSEQEEHVDSKIEVNRSFDRFFPILHPRHEDFYRLTVFQNNDTDIFTEFMLGSEPTAEILTHVRVHGTNEIHWISGVHRFKEGSIDFRTSSESGFNSHGYLLSSFVTANVQKLSARSK